MLSFSWPPPPAKGLSPSPAPGHHPPQPVYSVHRTLGHQLPYPVERELQHGTKGVVLFISDARVDGEPSVPHACQHLISMCGQGRGLAPLAATPQKSMSFLRLGLPLPMSRAYFMRHTDEGLSTIFIGMTGWPKGNLFAITRGERRGRGWLQARVRFSLDSPPSL